MIRQWEMHGRRNMWSMKELVKDVRPDIKDDEKEIMGKSLSLFPSFFPSPTAEIDLSSAAQHC